MNRFIDYLRVLAMRVNMPHIGLSGVIEIIILAVLIYWIWQGLKNTRASTLIKGIAVVGGFLALAFIFQLSTILWITSKIGSVALLALVILFQQDIRKFLESLGNRNFTKWFMPTSGHEKLFSDNTYSGLIRACQTLSENKIGALIVIEQDIPLKEYIDTGIDMDALVSEQLLLNIFEKNTALHDGAVIMRGDRILAATCYLPLSDNPGLDKRLGTRHRAAVGISEISDSFTIVVSEETGKITYAKEGTISSAVSISQLREVLQDVQMIRSDDSFRSFKFWKGQEVDE
ncbi:MAG: diadenylate cyclase CdaA [Lachnospiraceae bacterium]|nr:diadenylate cyclase CdaA [Candidatus Equihabitans merdae]